MIEDLKKSFKKMPYQKKQIAVLLCVPGLLFFISWKLILEKDIKEDARLSAQVDSMVKKVALQSQLTMLQSGYNKNRAMLAPSSRADWVIEAIYKAAQASGIKVNAVTPSNAPKDDVFRESEISIEATGTYHELGRFFEALENNKPGIFIQNFRFNKTSGSESESGGRLQSYMNVSVFSEI